MGIANMETNVTLNMKNKFALKAIVLYFLVSLDILGYVNGLKSMECVNFHLFVNLDMKKFKVLRILPLR